MKKSKKHIKKNKCFFVLGAFFLLVCVFACVFVFGGAKQDVSRYVLVNQTKENVSELEPSHNVEKLVADWEKYIKNNSSHGIEFNGGVFMGRTEDKHITLKWGTPVDKAYFIVKNGNVEMYRTNVMGTDSFTFSDGIHGGKYTFLLEFTDNGTKYYKKIERKFLDFDKLPVLTTFYIETEDGEDPMFIQAPKPKNKEYTGLTIINNDYKNAILNKNTPIKIRVHGNSSALIDYKKSYKIVFEDKKDLLGLGDEYADTEWVLLGQFGIKTYLGFEMGRAIGIEWEPRMRFVNVMLNGDWKGLYVLCEPVKRHPKRLNVDSDGFIIESDAYWWREQKDTYFPSSVLAKKVKFTFKYPKKLTSSDERFIATENQIKEIDNAIQNDLEHIDKYIDFDSHINWLLAHELLGTQDGFGSNMFFFKENPNGKLKMGPLWDFDSCVAWQKYDHSKFWTTESTYLPFLLENQDFKRQYFERYFTVVSTFEPTIRALLEKLRNVPGLKDSWILDDRGYVSRSADNLDDAIDSLTIWLHDHIEWLNQYMEKEKQKMSFDKTISMFRTKDILFLSEQKTNDKELAL